MRRWQWLLMIFLAIALLGCQNMQVKFPDTPIGRGNLFTESYRDSVNGYEIAAANPALLPAQKEGLQKQRAALIETYAPLAIYDEYVSTGQVPTSAMEIAVMSGLTRIEQWAYEKIGSQATLARKKLTDEEIEALLKKAFADTGLFGIKAESIDPVVLSMLFQLVREGLTFFFNLMEQTQMTETELMQRFADNYAWLQSFDPNSLPMVQ